MATCSATIEKLSWVYIKLDCPDGMAAAAVKLSRASSSLRNENIINLYGNNSLMDADLGSYISRDFYIIIYLAPIIEVCIVRCYW